MTNPTIVYWSHNDGEEHLYNETEDEAIQAYLDDQGDLELPDTLTLYGFARLEVPTTDLDPLNRVLEYLDEEYHA
jgi:hypothetical protein